MPTPPGRDAPGRKRRVELATFDEVLDAARAGESWAFDRLFRELSPSLARFAGARGVEDPDALVNDVLVEVFRSLPGFSGDHMALRGFVFHVARRRVIDSYRRQGRRPRATPLGGVDAPRVTDASQLPHEMPGLDHSGALSALDELTDDQREVLILRVICDLSLAETAMALDKPVTAVKALQRRAIGALRRKMSGQVVS